MEENENAAKLLDNAQIYWQWRNRLDKELKAVL